MVDISQGITKHRSYTVRKINKKFFSLFRSYPGVPSLSFGLMPVAHLACRPCS